MKPKPGTAPRVLTEGNVLKIKDKIKAFSLKCQIKFVSLRLNKCKEKGVPS